MQVRAMEVGEVKLKSGDTALPLFAMGDEVYAVNEIWHGVEAGAPGEQEQGQPRQLWILAQSRQVKRGRSFAMRLCRLTHLIPRQG